MFGINYILSGAFLQILRAFVAVSLTPNVEVRKLMESLAPLKGSRVPHGEELHLTLAFLGEISDAERHLLCELISSIRFGSFDLKTTQIGAFPDLRKARVAFVGFERGQIEALHKILSEKLPARYRENRNFVPHLTVSRFKIPLDIRGLFHESEGKDFGHYHIEKLSIYKSELTPQGSIYTEMCSVQLM